jgi:hypothetical protein
MGGRRGAGAVGVLGISGQTEYTRVLGGGAALGLGSCLGWAGVLAGV